MAGSENATVDLLVGLSADLVDAEFALPELDVLGFVEYAVMGLRYHLHLGRESPHPTGVSPTRLRCSRPPPRNDGVLRMSWLRFEELTSNEH